MTHQTINLKCPGCGAAVDTGTANCKYCGRQIVISTFNSVFNMKMPELAQNTKCYSEVLADHPDSTIINSSAAMCYLKLKLYDKALPCFERAIESNFDNPESYFYASVCLLKGQKAFNTHRNDIIKALELINAAIQIEPRGIFYYFMAYIKFDFHERKYLNISPSYIEELENSRMYNVTSEDIRLLFEVIGKPIPQEIVIF